MFSVQLYLNDRESRVTQLASLSEALDVARMALETDPNAGFAIQNGDVLVAVGGTRADEALYHFRQMLLTISIKPLDDDTIHHYSDSTRK